MLTLPWITLFLASPALWARASRRVGVGLLILTYGAALVNGRLEPAALVPLVLLVSAAFAVRQKRHMSVRVGGHMLFIALAVGLSMHLLPGFHNLQVVGPERFTPDAVSFTMFLNLDKPLIGFWLLLVLPWIQSGQLQVRAWTCGLSGALLTAAVCLLLGSLLGLVGWAPKWPEAKWVWCLNNLLLVTLTEEALFRGYIQGGLSRLLRTFPYGGMVALAVAAVLFGLAHIAGGWQWMVVGMVAGLGYGLAYRFGGLQAAVLAHFGLNGLHFFLFTYPMLEPVSQF